MVVIMTPHLQFGLTMLLVWGIVSRVAYVLLNIYFGNPMIVANRRIKTLVVLGSGGHTGEMLKLIKNLNTRYKPFVFVVASTDKLSRDRLADLDMTRDVTSSEESQKLLRQEDSVKKSDDEAFVHLEGAGCELRGRNVNKPDLSSSTSPKCNEKSANSSSERCLTPILETFPRSREVGQSYITSVLTTILASFYAIKIIAKHRPDLILVNGPGTCVPICFSGLFFRMLGIGNGRITYVESLCRVRSVSLTGKILYWIADDFFVQWPELQTKYPRSKYLGRLV